MEFLAIAAILVTAYLIIKHAQRSKTPSQPRPAAKHSPFMEAVPVAGTAHHREGALDFVRIAEREPVAIRLEAEPENPHDKHAIRVVGLSPSSRQGRRGEPRQIGYLPRRVAYRISINNELPRLAATLVYATAESHDDFDGPEILIDIRRT